ncbi:DUF3419 family protein [Prosthecomicrobium sp. N25]|uniref:DUF3419 family protein n=1 Tax=Prosthecomicrobium sp. N25 TaxID=3129254 RepID=UPI003077E0AC
MNAAVGVTRAMSAKNLLDRLFAWAFTDLVYAQIWEDPVVDMHALGLRPGLHMVAIASGGCNVLSYLAREQLRITAVDLNPAHVAYGRLRKAAAQVIRDYPTFAGLVTGTAGRANREIYAAHLRERLDPETRAWWESRGRLRMLEDNPFRYGLLGRFIRASHGLARLYGVDPRAMLRARTRDEQIRIFETHLAPLFDRAVLRWLASRSVSLYGLGIPSAQYEVLACGRPMADVLRERLRRLACDHDLADNYFARQAFGLRYEGGEPPPYLDPQSFPRLQANAAGLEILNRSYTDHLRTLSPASVDRYVLLDAQDWMNDRQLAELWGEITRTARPGARVIFRTAAEPTILPGRVPHEILTRWTYQQTLSEHLHGRDRSAIYGGFHLYVFGQGPGEEGDAP